MHGLTAIGRKPEKVKVIWYHYYRRNKETGPDCQLMKMKLNRKMKNPNRNENMSDEDFVFADLGKQISSLIITCLLGSVSMGPWVSRCARDSPYLTAGRTGLVTV